MNDRSAISSVPLASGRRCPFAGVFARFAACLLGAVAWLAPVRAENPDDPHVTVIAIAAAMRTWQERYLLVSDTGLPVTWPKNEAGTPAESFPDDAFYCEDLKNDELAAVLVRDLARAMTAFRVIPGRNYIDTRDNQEHEYELPFLASFLVAPANGDLRNLSGRTTVADMVFAKEPSNLLLYRKFLSDASPFSDITAENYVDKFAQMAAYLKLLDTAFILYADHVAVTSHYTFTRNPSSSAATPAGESESLQSVAQRALASYRGVGSGAVFSATPGLFMESRTITEEPPQYGVTISSSSGFFTLDRSAGAWKTRLEGHLVDLFVRREDFGLPLAAVNYPESLPGTFQHLAQVADGARYDSPVFEVPPADTISVDGLTAGEFPQLLGWNLEPYLVVTDGWKHTLDSLEAACECAACVANCTLESKTELGSVEITISLGADGEGSLGTLTLRAEKPSPLLARPEGLVRNVSGNVRSIVDYSAPTLGASPQIGSDLSFQGYDTAFDPDALSLQRRPLRQLQSAVWVAQVVDLGSAGYRLDFAHRDGLSAPDPNTGVIDISGTQPFVSFAFVHVAGDLNRFQFTRTEVGAPDRVALYEYDQATNAWSLTTGTGAALRRETVARSDEGNEWTETRTIRGPDDVVVSATAYRYRVFPWNNRFSPIRARRGELIERADDPSGENRITRYFPYEDPGVDRAAYGQVRLTEYPDGSWVRYEYDPVSGLPVRTIRPFGDAGPQADEDECRVTIEQRGPLADADGDGEPEVLKTVIERALGLEVGRSHRVEFSRPVLGEGQELLRVIESNAVVPGASWDAPDSLRTEIRSFLSGPDAGRTYSTLRPDGTMSLTRYARAGGRLTTTTEVGEPDAAHAQIVRGRRSVTVTHPQGSVQSTSIHDIETGLLLDRAETFDEDFDEFGRPLTVIHLDGTAEQYVYGCCGLESFTDRAGTQETHNYDSLKRRISTTRAGLTTISIYDAAGRVVETRQRSRNNQLRTISRSEFTPGGRLLVVRDLLDRRTRFAEEVDAQGHNVRTATRPDLATRIETSHRDGRPLSVGGTAEHPLAFEYSVVADTHDGRSFNAEVATSIRLGANGERTEWTRTYSDMLGRTYKVEVPAFSGSATDKGLSFFNAKGQLVRQRTAEGVTTLFAYDGQGRLTDSALDANGNSSIDYDGTDRITRSVATVVQDPVRGVLSRSITSAWLTLDDATSTLVSETEMSAESLTTWSRTWGRETESRTEFPGGGEVRQIVRGPDGVVSTSITVDGFATGQSVVNEPGESFGHQTFRYDEWGRSEAVIDARTGETTTTFDAGDRARSIISPAPDATQPRQTTVFGYDALDRVTTVTLPDDTVQFRAYFSTGETRREWGARQYPVEYAYDAQGRLATMTTWQDYAGAGGAATTRWKYHPARGALERKTYEDGTHVDYTYTPAGRLQTRTWARGLVTTYGYDPLTADLATIDYSDATPDIGYGYDRAGRIASKTDATGTCSYTYTEDVLTSESHSTGSLAGLTLGRSADLGRLAGLTVQGPAGLLYQATYGYRDVQNRDTGRLVSVGLGSAQVGYTYEANSPLLRDTVWSQGSTERLRATTLFDHMNRLTSRTTGNGAGQVLRSFGYAYNAANQREQTTLESGEAWRYRYDELGQVIGGSKRTTADQMIPGYDFGYQFDDIGNREATTTNGRTANYVANLLNQYEQRAVPRTVDVLGQGPDNAAVTVNELASVRTGKVGPDDYFYTPYPANVAGAHDLTVRSRISGTPDQVFDEQRRAFLASNPEVFAHDADGNLTDDWRWHYTWDAENRLIAMETQATATLAGVPRQRLEFVYDYMGRRTAKRAYVWNSALNAYSLQLSAVYLYDGWNLLAELTASSLQPTASYLWGSDLSGSLQGAGGVGGLLLAQTATGNAIPAYDGNGNVIAYADLSTGASVADFEYGPFGETLRATGSFAASAAFRFSTKFTDAETELVYYGFRYYSPATGRWLSRDPIEEQGGANLYGMIGNDAVGRFDVLGLSAVTAEQLRDRLCRCKGRDGKMILEALRRGTLGVYLGDGPLIADIVERANHSNVIRKDAVLDGAKFPGTNAIYVDLSKGEEASLATLAHEYRHTVPSNQALLKRSAVDGENDAYLFEEKFRIDNSLPPLYQDLDAAGKVTQKTETTSVGGRTISLTYDITSRRGERMTIDARGNATFTGRIVPFPEVIAEIARQRHSTPPSPTAGATARSTTSVPTDTINFRTKQGTNVQKIDPSFWVCIP